MDTKFYIANPVHTLCRLAGVSVSEVADAAKISAQHLNDKERGITASETFALWTALYNVSADPELPITLARRAARVQIVPTLMAYWLSSTVEKGLQQLATFKRATGPFSMEVRYVDNLLSATVQSSERGLKFPKHLGLFEAVYIVELIRLSTATHVVPVSVALSQSLPNAAAFFGVTPTKAATVTLVFSKEDGRRELVSSDEQMLTHLQPTFEADLKRHKSDTPTSEKVTLFLGDQQIRPSSTLMSVARSLGQSPRALQRSLQSEGTSFEEVLRQTRLQIAMTHLIKGDDRISEIAAKLGYRDPNSFYRAFQRWTGVTPNQVRESGKEKL